LLNRQKKTIARLKPFACHLVPQYAKARAVVKVGDKRGNQFKSEFSLVDNVIDEVYRNVDKLFLFFYKSLLNVRFIVGFMLGRETSKGKVLANFRFNLLLWTIFNYRRG